MNIEYLLFNILALAGPLFFSVQKKYGFRPYINMALISIFITAIPYLIWDSLVTGSHWFFNNDYTLPVRILGLPIGEILFFLTVPYACLFTWQMIILNSKNSTIQKPGIVKIFTFILPFAGIYTVINGHYYSSLVLLVLGGALITDMLFKTNLYTRKQFYFYLGLIILFTLIFNGYLTSRPVVLYGESFQVGFRIFTIPVEDFGYGISLMYFSTIIFELLKNRR